MEDDLQKMEDTLTKKMEDDLKRKWKKTPFFFENQRRPSFFDTGSKPHFFEDWRRPHFYLNETRPTKKCNFNQQHSAAQATKNISAQMRKSTLIGCDIIVN